MATGLIVNRSGFISMINDKLSPALPTYQPDMLANNMEKGFIRYISGHPEVL